MHACVQLFGYYAAALTVDWKWVGRKRMTTFSFSMVCPLPASSCFTISLPTCCTCNALSCMRCWRPPGTLKCVPPLAQVAAIFLCVAAAYPELVKPSGIHWFQFLYYFSSFWALFGSHTTSLSAASSLPPAMHAQLTSLHTCKPFTGPYCVLDGALDDTWLGL